MKVAVTGSSGFIGRHVVIEAQKRGFEVVEVDRANGIDILGDNLEDAIKDCDAIIHCAGVLGTEELFYKAEEAVEVNVKGTIRLLELCRKHDISFTAITLPFVFESVYRSTKECAYQLTNYWHKYLGVKVSHVCAYNVFGAYQKTTGVQKVVPTFATRAWRNEPLPIWGDGTQLMDLVYVDDVARMLVDATKFHNGEMFAAGTAQGISVNDLAEKIIKLTGSSAGVEHLPMRLGEPPRVKIVADKAGWDLLDWHPEFREEDLVKTVEFYKGK